MVGEFFKLLLAGLFPSHDAGAEEVYRWRLTVAGAIIFIGVMQVLTIGALIGWPAVLFAGYVQVADVADIKKQQVEIRIGQIEPLILDAREKQCLADNMDSLRFFTTQLNERLALYAAIARRDYRLPSCDELVIKKRG